MPGNILARRAGQARVAVRICGRLAAPQQNLLGKLARRGLRHLSTPADQLGGVRVGSSTGFPAVSVDNSAILVCFPEKMSCPHRPAKNK